MSYARSPRPLCSTTMGTRPKACGSQLFALSIFMSALLVLPSLVTFETFVVFATRSRLLLLAHQFIKNCGLFGHFCFAQYPLDHIVFNRHPFNFLKALRLGVVPA